MASDEAVRQRRKRLDGSSRRGKFFCVPSGEMDPQMTNALPALSLVALAGEIESKEIDTAPFRDRYGPNSVQLRPVAAE